MKVLILGAGFGTRLERDLRNDISGNYSQLVGVPKPLLPIGSLPLASHWVEALKGKAGMQDVYVVVGLLYDKGKITFIRTCSLWKMTIIHWIKILLDNKISDLSSHQL